MISAAANSLMPDFSGLTAEISKSVSNIKTKAQALQHEAVSQPQTSVADTAYKNFSLHNYAVSYLEPQALYSLQKFVSETADAEKLKQQTRQKNIFKEDENTAPENSEDVTATPQISFWEELTQTTDLTKTVRGMETYGLRTNGDNGGFFLTATQSNVSETYAADAYDYIFNINAKPQVLIDFMHQFNRNYDYKI